MCLQKKINHSSLCFALTLMGFKALFRLQAFWPIFDKYTPFNTIDGSIIPFTTTSGSRRQVGLEDCVALILAWTRTRGSMMNLNWFLVWQWPIWACFQHFGWCIVIHVLKCNPHSSIKIMSKENNIEFKAAITKISNPQKYLGHNGLVETLLTEVSWSIKLRDVLQGLESRSLMWQMFLFLFQMEQSILHFQCPGCVHDSQAAKRGKIYEKLESV